MSVPVLEARDARCTFSVSTGLLRPRRPLHAVSGVTVEVQKGNVLGLVGESGCGKTTLARMMLGLLKPTGGDIRIDGRPITDLNRAEITRRIQPVFQDPYSSLNPRKSIGSIISLPLRVHGITRSREVRMRVDEMMELVGLPRRFYDSYPNQLSGGQRQRVAVARALIMRPEVVICDEPTSALDVSVQSQILNLLQDLRSELSLTYILISHNLAVVEHMATNVAVMYLGRVVEQAETRELFRNPRHPYTRALLNSVLTPEPGLGIPDTQLGAAFPNPVDPPSGCTFHPRCAEVMPHCERVAPHPIQLKGVSVECHLYDGATQAGKAAKPAKRTRTAKAAKPAPRTAKAAKPTSAARAAKSRKTPAGRKRK